MPTVKSKKKSVKRKAYGGIAFIPSIKTHRSYYPDQYTERYEEYFEDLDPYYPIVFHNTSIMPKKTQADERKSISRTIRQVASKHPERDYFGRDNKSIINPKEISKQRVHIVPMPEKTRFRAWMKAHAKAGKLTRDIKNRLINSEELVPITRSLDRVESRYGESIVYKELERSAIHTRARKRKEHGSLRHYVPRR